MTGPRPKVGAVKALPISETILVCGPPGSGKTTYVMERHAAGDLVVDVDTLYMALSGLPMYDKPHPLLMPVLEARDAVVAYLKANWQHPKTWIITGGATEQERSRYDGLRTETVMLAVPAEECLERIAADPRRKGSDRPWEEIVQAWWSDYTSDQGEKAYRKPAKPAEDRKPEPPNYVWA